MNAKKRREHEPDAEPDTEHPSSPLHLRMDREFVADLDTIIGWMRTDPAIRRLHTNKIGRAKAIRYAVGRLIDNPPPHITAG